ncbi:hypothetical protein LZ496_13430 [Sphingomonas sp. NSE70-1]|uniref:DUF4956 domain-containing protein n=1 Tax=Sphingomonas caseinilyticus TaxID=2908205 RepID=A0ABT0RXQ1_9SPHN|nr:hypothetical protein [Sphingomonas caseinilyticus]MCL6699778.1 hypothetical protein [Sphingomonas caseinilyticus]
MRAVKLLVQLSIYYLILFGGAWLLIHNNPEMQSYLPIGGAEALINSGGGKSSTLEAVAQSQEVKTLGQSLGWMAVAILGALITSFPVTWVYMATRTSDEYDQSIISTILILPSVVTSIVVVVQHSLALAFALGGIAGAVRFKNSLKSSGDALYILLSVGIGLASGIGAVELALVMSLAFNYCFVALWISEYGEREGMKRYMSDFNPHSGPASAAAVNPAPDVPPPPPAPPQS